MCPTVLKEKALQTPLQHREATPLGTLVMGVGTAAMGAGANPETDLEKWGE